MAICKRYIRLMQEVKQAIREPYAWPGGYPKYLIMEDGGVLSVESAREEFQQVCSSTLAGYRDGWRVAAVAINWEDPALFCDHSGKRIESAYAEDEATKEDRNH